MIPEHERPSEPWLAAVPPCDRSARCSAFGSLTKSALKCSDPSGRTNGVLGGSGLVISTPGHEDDAELIGERLRDRERPRSRLPLHHAACGWYSTCSVRAMTSSPSRHASCTWTVGQTLPSENTVCRWKSPFSVRITRNIRHWQRQACWRLPEDERDANAAPGRAWRVTLRGSGGPCQVTSVDVRAYCC